MSTCAHSRQIDRANYRRLNIAMVAWALSFVLSSAIAANDNLGGVVHFASAVVPIVTGVPVVLLFAHYIREGDELTRLIELQALAIAAGAVFLVLPAVQVAQGSLGIDTFVSVPLVVLSVVYAGAVTLIRRRYR
jgi:hypothetical protein